MKNWSKKVKIEIEGVGPIRRDPRRNSVQKAVPGVPYGGMATQLVTKSCDLGSLGVPGPASAPLCPRTCIPYCTLPPNPYPYCTLTPDPYLVTVLAPRSVFRIRSISSSANP